MKKRRITDSYWNISKFDEVQFIQAMDILYRNSVNIIENAVDIDPRMLDSKYWKLDKMGNLTNTWCRFYTEEEVAKTYEEYRAEGLNKAASFSAVQLDAAKKRFSERTTLDGYGILLYGVSINLSKSPTIIETNVNGFNSPVYTKYSNSAFNINITALESTQFYWQQNIKKLERLVEIMDSNQSLYITNPQLNITYNINKVIVKDYSIGQDNRFYSHTPISISCKNDTKIDIIKPVTKKGE